MTRRGELVLWSVAMLSTLGGVAGWRASAGSQATVIEEARGSAVRALPRTDSQTLASHASRTVNGDPFRLERKPAYIRFGAAPPVTSSRPRVARPRLVLTGIFGPPWQAVLEGVPGREGSVVVAEGQTFGDLQIRSVRRDTVVVAGTDTTWRLAVRRPW